MIFLYFVTTLYTVFRNASVVVVNAAVIGLATEVNFLWLKLPINLISNLQKKKKLSDSFSELSSKLIENEGENVN
jgi:hypothetical protein